MPDLPGVPRDRDVRPTLDEVLALRARRTAAVRAFLDALTDEALAGETTPTTDRLWPGPGPYPVAECLWIILNEEREHRRFAERDLAQLT